MVHYFVLCHVLSRVGVIQGILHICIYSKKRLICTNIFTCESKIILAIILTSAVQFYFRYSNFMKQKSIIIGLPVVPFNQSKHSDVCQYLQYVQDMLVDIYTPEVQYAV